MKKALRILKRVFYVLLTVSAVVGISTWLFMRKASFGKLPEGERLARIERSSHYKEGIFVNLTETPMNPDGIGFLDMSVAVLFDRHEHSTPGSSIPVTRSKLQVSYSLQPVITWFGHSSVLIQWNGKSILTDPMFSRHASPVQFAGPSAFAGPDEFSVNDLPPVDIVIISHDHYDHLDHNSILQLKDKVEAFYVPLGVGAHLEHWGVDKSKIRELDWWEESRFDGDINIIATPSRHFSGRGFSFNKTSWSSWMIILPAHRFFFNGDSGYEQHFKTIGDKYGPIDMAFIETGQYSEYWPYIHMMPEQSVQAAVDLKARVLLPVHWGKFALAMHAWYEPVQRVLKKAAVLKQTVITPRPGQQVFTDSTLTSQNWWEDVPH